jgi:toxin-antitoxin system PIN domain toxin
MILLDVNILIAVHRKDAESHEEITAWLDAEIADSTSVGVSELVLSGFLRVVTHPKIFRKPTPLVEALEFAEQFRTHDAVRLFAPGSEHWRLFTQLCRKTGAKGNFVPDAYHAALAIETGCEWISLDRGFSRFPGLRWRHPLD